MSDYASPPPAPITRVPTRDSATAATSNREPARYAPPVHVTPPAHYTARPMPRSTSADQSTNGLRNTTRLVGYSDSATVAKLSDESLSTPAVAPARLQATRPVNEGVASNHLNGLHGYRNAPTRTVQPRVQGKIRRPGLQDRISSAFGRMSAAKSAAMKGEPTEAIPNEVVGQDKLVVRYDAAVNEEAYYNEQDARLPTSKWVSDESGFEEASLNPVAFATDYQRPLEEPQDDRGADRVDEEIMPMTREVTLREHNPIRPPRVASAARSYSRQGRSKSTRGQQISVLTRSRQGSGTKGDDDFSELPNRLRPKQGIDKVDDTDPLNDDLEDLSEGDDDLDDDLDDLDRDIDEELKRLRDREDDGLDDEDDDSASQPEEKECATFRNELLDSSIRDIALDISPPASSLPGSNYPISRSWTDRSGNVIATGAMQDFRRGYVILDSGQKLAYARLSESDLAAVSDSWRIPKICTVGNRGQVDRNWIPQTFTWTASNLCHKTLFFENVQLERYGHSHGPFTQPVQSVAHFFVSLVTVPYQAAIHPANECQYALGYYRPGNCAPWLKDPIPISLDGAKRQALAVTGLSFIP